MSSAEPTEDSLALEGLMMRSEFHAAKMLLLNNPSAASQGPLVVAIKLRAVGMVRLFLAAGAADKSEAATLFSIANEHADPEILAMLNHVVGKSQSNSGHLGPC